MRAAAWAAVLVALLYDLAPGWGLRTVATDTLARWALLGSPWLASFPLAPIIESAHPVPDWALAVGTSVALAAAAARYRG